MEMLAHKLEKSQKSLCNSKKMFKFVPIFAYGILVSCHASRISVLHKCN